MKKKYGFTIIELAAVIIILGILSGAWIWKLSTNDTEKYKSEICINQIYGELSNFLHSANTSKLLTYQEPNGTQTEISPNTYNLSIENSTITFKADNQNINEINIENIKDCQQKNKYSVQFDSNFSDSKLLPGLQAIGNQSGITFKNGDTELKKDTIGILTFNFCQETTPQPICEEFAKITLDRRSGILRKSFCQLYNTDDNPTTTDIDERKTCAQRSL